MADIGELNLTIRVNPDTGQLQIFNDEVAQLQGQVKDLTQESEGLNKSLTRPLENVGVHIFGRELLGAMGISQATRPILTLLSVGIREVGESFGVAAAAAMPYVFGLAALAAVLYKVRESHKETREQMEAVLATEKGGISTMDDYVAAGGRLSVALNKMAADLKKAAQETVSKIEADTKAKLIVDEAALADAKAYNTQLQHTIGMQSSTMASQLAADAIKKHQKAVDDDRATLEANQHGFATWTDYVKSGTQALDKATDALKKHGDELKKHSQEQEAARLQELSTANQAYAQQVVAAEKMYTEEGALEKAARELNEATIEDEMTQEEKKEHAIEKFQERQLAVIEADYKKAVDAAIASGGDIVQVNAAQQRALIALDNNTLMQRRNNLSILQSESRKVAEGIASGIGNAFAQSIVEGKSFGDSMRALAKQVVEEIISDLVRIAIEKLIIDKIMIASQTTTSAAMAASMAAAGTVGAAGLGIATAAATALGTALSADLALALALDAALLGA